MPDTSTTNTRPRTFTPPRLTCECFGCRRHIAALEAHIRQIALDNNRLSDENARLQREVGRLYRELAA